MARQEYIMNSRIAHIDIAKAIGIMLIITSHIMPSAEVRDCLFFYG